MDNRPTLGTRCCAPAALATAIAPASEVSRKRRRSIRGVVSQILDIDAVAESPDPRAMLLADLDDFVSDHRPRGQRTGDATEPEADGYMVRAICARGHGLDRQEAALARARGQGARELRYRPPPAHMLRDMLKLPQPGAGVVNLPPHGNDTSDHQNAEDGPDHAHPQPEHGVGTQRQDRLAGPNRQRPPCNATEQCVDEGPRVLPRRQMLRRRSPSRARYASIALP